MVKNQEHIIKVKRFFLCFLAIFFPWVILFMDDNPLGAVVALVLQTTLVGWIPAVIWAWGIVHQWPESPPPVVKKTEKSPKKSVSKVSK